MDTRRHNLAARRRGCGLTHEEFAESLGVDRRSVQRWESGEGDPQPWQQPRIAALLRVTPRELEGLLGTDRLLGQPADSWALTSPPTQDDEFAAWELARRAQVSDVSPATLTGLESAFTDLAVRYPVSPPGELLDRVRKHLAYVAHLMDAKKTLKDHRRLLVVGGWFSLLGATLHIDLNQQGPATAALRSAATLAHEAGNAEIHAWCYETDAWRVLTDGDYPRAVELSRAAQELAPAGSSAAVQSIAQEGRASARLDRPKETYAAVGRVEKMADVLEIRERPEHHYQYDPAKVLSYRATTLAWIGDPSAEKCARAVIAKLDPPDDVSKWPRRVASANIDLALSLLAGDRLDEACHTVQKAIRSGRVVPSNHWRALEVVKAVERRGLPEATDLREAYEGLAAKKR